MELERSDVANANVHPSGPSPVWAKGPDPYPPRPAPSSAMTFHAKLEVARRADLAEIEFCAVAGRQEMPDLAEVRAGGGVALCGRPGSPLNKVLGLGLHGPVSDDDLAAIEA